MLHTSFALRKKYNAFASASAMLLIVFLFLAVSPVVNHHDDTHAETIYSTTTLAMTTPNIDLNLSINSIDGTFGSSSSDFSVTTNNATGYVLSIRAAEDVDTNSQLFNNDAVLDSIDSPISIETFNGDSNLNGQWGYKPSMLNSAENTDYLPAPTYEGTIINDTDSANQTEDIYNLAIGARADINQPVGKYSSNSVVLSAVANVASLIINYNKNTTDEVTDLPINQASSLSNDVLLSSLEPKREGYLFLGWCDGETTNEDDIDFCSGTTYKPGDIYGVGDIDETIINSADLSALWSPANERVVKYIDGNNVNTVRYECSFNDTLEQMTFYSHTTNINDDGSKNSEYYTGSYSGTRDVINIPEAESVHINLSYAISNGYDYVYVFKGNYTGSVSRNMTIRDTLLYKFTGVNTSTVTTVELDIPGDTVTIVFYKNSTSQTRGYGYYAVASGIGKVYNTTCNPQPISGSYYTPVNRPDAMYVGWDIDESADGPDAQFTSEQQILDSIKSVTPNPFRLYATYSVAHLDTGPRIKSKLSNLAGYSSNITGIHKALSLPSGFVPTDANTISVSSSHPELNIYAWYDNGLINIYTPAPGIKGNVNMYGAFDGFRNLTDLSGISDWDMSSVEDGSDMFSSCESLTDLTPLASWDMSSLSNTFWMFANNKSLESLEGLESWNTASLYDISQMFYQDGALKDISALANWDMDLVARASYAFQGDYSIENLEVLNNWTLAKYDTMYGIFDQIPCSIKRPTWFLPYDTYCFEIEYDGNGADGGNVANQIRTSGISENLYDNGYYKNGYVFAGWNTSANGGGSLYLEQTPYVFYSSTKKLYATWGKYYTINYHSNGGVNSVEYLCYRNTSQNKNMCREHSGAYEKPSKDDHLFMGWSTTDGSAEVDYIGEAEAMLAIDMNSDEDMDVYAVFTPVVYLDQAYSAAGKEKIEVDGNEYYTLQDMETSICESSNAVGFTLDVVDIRDNHIYKIGKLADNKCWLLDNLALDLMNESVRTKMSSANTNSTDSDIDRMLNGTDSISGTSTTWPSDYQQGFAWSIIKNDSADIIPTDSLSTAGGWKSGMYYNLCAASAGKNCTGRNSSDDYGFGNITGDICPTNWRLPAYRAVGGEYVKEGEVLYDSYVAEGSTSKLDAFRNAFRLPYSGYVNDSGNINYLNNYNYFWTSSNASYSPNSWNIYSVSSSGLRYSSLSRKNGATIRCVAK